MPRRQSHENSEAELLELFRWSLARARGEVYAATGPRGEQVGRAEALYLAGNVNQALTLFQEALVTATDEEVVAYLRDRAIALRIETGLAGDDWVDMMPGEGIAGWHPVQGIWTREPDGLLAGTAGSLGSLIVCNARTEGNFEMQGEIELPPDAERGTGGVALGIRNLGWVGWTSFRIEIRDGHAKMGIRFSPPTQEKEVTLKQTNTFLLQVWDERATVYLNGELVFADYELEPDHHPQLKGQVGLGSWRCWADSQLEVPTRYRNVQIRRLTTRPAPQRTE